MKCIQKDGRILRVKESEAEAKVQRQGWKYVSKNDSEGNRRKWSYR